jgi:signal transduction histidine kinase
VTLAGARSRLRLWPHSLIGQMLLAVGLALLLVQSVGALLVYRAQSAGREADLVHAAAFRLMGAERRIFDADRPPGPPPPPGDDGGAGPPATQLMVSDHPGYALRFPGGRGPSPYHSNASPLLPGETRQKETEQDLRTILESQGMRIDDVVIVVRKVADDAVSMAHLHNRPGGARELAEKGEVMIAGAHHVGGDWLIARVFQRPGFEALVLPLVWQTVLIYFVVVGAVAFTLGRITRPLAALTRRLESFAETRSLEGQLVPSGPDDMRRLIEAHNAMEARIAALLDEKDVMLGAIGHDLKTPLAALRVRIESVENDIERDKMAATIEDIVRTLDDILSLARVGRPSDPRERSELSALAISVVEEYEDMGADIVLGDTVRVAAVVRPTWLRRAMRNLIGNALRYGRQARVSLHRDNAFAVVRIDDDGPGIAPGDVERMMDPFTRGDPSRNSETGGAGLGLALARAIADQHGGSIRLANRMGLDGSVQGLTAELWVPVN